ncbi:MAG: hypothetical protein M0D57_08580 [Sphingobacteriales bacterium JAD_PAG50586_3]|nr:MAG: hypothetical protein M0D57_08580 [Sphingobacteriales bacterium JAD_PAG50586_3]
MHGKPKAQRVYAEGQTVPISETEYFYKCTTGPNNTLKLVNEVDLVNTSGSIAKGTLGKEIDMVFDSRYAFESSNTYGVNMNTELSFAWWYLPIPFPFPSWGSSKNTSFVATTTKIVTRSGIIDKVVVTKDGSHLETHNLLYDSQTGDVLLTQTQNEFRDKEYSFTYPAHWVYDAGMGQTYKNINSRGNITIDDGVISTLASVFVPGDEVGLWQSGAFKHKAWVLNNNSTNVSFIDIDGAPIPSGDYEYKIIRSGRRNMQSTPIGSLQTRLSVINTGATALGISNANGILNASAVEMSDKWQMLTGEGMRKGAENTECCIYGWNSAVQTPGSCLVQFLSDISEGGNLQINTKRPVLAPAGCFGGSGTTPYCYTGIKSTASSGLPAPLAGQAKLTMNFYESATPCSTASTLIATYELYCLSPTSEFDENDFNGKLDMGVKGIDFTGCAIGVPLSVKQQLDDHYPGYLLLRGVEGSHGDNFVLIRTYWNTSFTENFPFTQRVYMDCEDGDDVSNTCDIPLSEIVNPYVTGVRGNWRQKKSYAFNTKRNYSGINNSTNIRVDGTYSEFIPFWKPSGTTHIKEPSLSSPNGGWQWTSEVTKYSPYGFEVENKDPLNRYSATVYGYYNSMPSAVGNNARYNQLAFDGFEDYEFPSLFQELKGVCILKPHWNFVESASPSQLSTTHKHSGKISLKLATGTSLSNSRSVDGTALSTQPFENYVLQPEDKLGLFAPQEGNYVMGGWIYSPVNDYVDSKILVKQYDASNTLISTTTVIADPATKPIEKWVRVEGTFSVGATIKKIVVEIVNDTDGDCYYDDLRIHPYNGNMKSFVYDPVSLRLLAQLDENNYATFYEYDEEGTLIRVKKETERGIMTIQENRQSNSK